MNTTTRTNQAIKENLGTKIKIPGKKGETKNNKNPLGPPMLENAALNIIGRTATPMTRTEFEADLHHHHHYLAIFISFTVGLFFAKMH